MTKEEKLQILQGFLNVQQKTKEVFIVHENNEKMQLVVSHVVSQLGLEPIVLHEQSNEGRTIIEKYDSLSENVSFAIVLLSADDETSDGRHRASQNVILELGYFIAKLGAENVIALYDSSLSKADIPFEISGINYEPYDNANGTWRFKIVQYLKAGGFDIDENSLIGK